MVQILGVLLWVRITSSPSSVNTILVLGAARVILGPVGRKDLPFMFMKGIMLAAAEIS
jgi:hypothetical protein